MKINKHILMICLIASSLSIPTVHSRWYDESTLNKGEKLFQLNCASCHKANAEGTLEWKKTNSQGILPPPPLNGSAHAWHHNKEALKNTILAGGAKLGGTMPGFKDKLTDNDIDAVIAYFQSKWPDELYKKWDNRTRDSQIPTIASTQNKPESSQSVEDKMTLLLKLRLGNDKVSKPVETPVADIYLTKIGKNYAYLTKDGRFIFMGNLIDLELGQNLTNLAKTNTAVPVAKPSIANNGKVNKREMTDLLKSTLGSDQVSEPIPTPVTDIYQVQFGSNFAYLSKDGRYVFMANLVNLEQGINLTTIAKHKSARVELARFANKDKAIFPARGKENAVINVFTDTACSTCKKLFKEVPKLQEAGISVQYLPFSDDGPKGAGYQTLKQIWCSKDKAKALPIGKGLENGTLAAGDCADSKLVDESYALGKKIGVIGTPAIFKENGEQIKGYVPYQELIPRVLEN